MSHFPFSRPFAALVLVVASACGSSGEDGSSSSGSSVMVVDEPPGANCPAGGKKLVVQNDGQSPTTSYVCNGIPGGGAGSSISVTIEPPGAICPTGGQRIVTVDLQTQQPQVSFVCNGMPAPAITMPWDVLSASTVAAPNRGYFTIGSSKVTVTLPVSATLLPGASVEVQAVGAGGFAVVPGAGQQILFSQDVVAVPGNAWAPHGVSRSWSHVVSSANGAILAATADPGVIDVSTDYGASWSSTGPAGVTSGWSALAASADGTRLFAATPTNGPTPGRIYVSVDAGAHWGQCTNVTGNWSGLAASADGNQLVATLNGGNVWVITGIGSIGTTPGCTTFTSQDWSRAWSSVTSSADGSVLTAAVRGGQLFMSTDFGDNWSARAANAYWDVVVSSANGARVVAAMNTAVGQGQLYVSDDLGFSWTPLVGAGPSWPALAMSADGTRLTGVACTAANSCQVMVSADGGANWTSRNGTVGAWTSVASSADGQRLLAAGTGARLYTSVAPSGTSALLEGVYGSRLQVRYAGPNTWIVSDELGAILAF